MAQKDSRMDDVKRADKVTPSATSRPILVSNGPTMTTDPMMAPPEEAKKDGEAGEDGILSHTAKTISPIDESVKETDHEAAPEPAANETTVEPPAEETQKPEEPKTKEDDKPVAKDEQAEATSSESPSSDTNRDTDAAVSAEEIAEAEAKVKREQELEVIIDSEKFAVPIDAVQRKRSRIATMCLCILAVLLAVALLDVIADVGIVKVPASVPHTHYFSK